MEINKAWESGGADFGLRTVAGVSRGERGRPRRRSRWPSRTRPAESSAAHLRRPPPPRPPTSLIRGNPAFPGGAGRRARHSMFSTGRFWESEAQAAAPAEPRRERVFRTSKGYFFFYVCFFASMQYVRSKRSAGKGFGPVEPSKQEALKRPRGDRYVTADRTVSRGVVLAPKRPGKRSRRRLLRAELRRSL